MSRPLQVQINDLAKAQVRAAEEWWRFNRPSAPNAIREEFERAASLIASPRSALAPETSPFLMFVACLSIESGTTSITA